MNNFFKMSLVAAAVALTGTANAGTMTSIDSATFSAEGIQYVTATEQELGGFSYTVDTDYEAGAVITFTYTAGALGTSATFPDSITTAGVVVAPLTAIGGTMTLTKSAQTADSVSYTVTAKQGSGSVIKNVITIPTSDAGASTPVAGVKLNTSAIKAGPVTVKASAVYQGVAFDPDATVTTVAPTANYVASTLTQFGSFAVAVPATGSIVVASGALTKLLSTANFDATIAYTAPAGAKMPARAVIGIDDTKGNDLSAMQITTSYEVLGKFAGFKATQFTGGTASLTTSGFKLVQAAASAPTAGATARITPSATVNSALEVQKFNIVPSIMYSTVTKTFDAVYGGQWTVDAELANIPYMPYGTGISQIIYVTNVNATTAQVSATATDEAGNSYALGVIGTAKGNGAVTKFTTPIKTALANQGFTDGKVSIDLMFVGLGKVESNSSVKITGDESTLGASADATFALAKGTIKINSAYNINGTDRGFVSNTTNGSN